MLAAYYLHPGLEWFLIHNGPYPGAGFILEDILSSALEGLHLLIHHKADKAEEFYKSWRPGAF